MAPKSSLPTTRIATLSAGTRAQSDAELVTSWADSLRSAHSRRNFEKTALRFLEALPAGGIPQSDGRGRAPLAKITEGLSDATAQQYVLRVKSLLSYGHKLGYIPFNAGVTIKIRPDQSRGQLAKRIPEYVGGYVPRPDLEKFYRQDVCSRYGWGWRGRISDG